MVVAEGAALVLGEREDALALEALQLVLEDADRIGALLGFGAGDHGFTVHRPGAGAQSGG